MLLERGRESGISVRVNERAGEGSRGGHLICASRYINPIVFEPPFDDLRYLLYVLGVYQDIHHCFSHMCLLFSFFCFLFGKLQPTTLSL